MVNDSENYEDGLLGARLEQDDGITQDFLLFESFEQMESFLQKNRYRIPRREDYHFDTTLPQEVRNAMEKQTVYYSFLLGDNPKMYFYRHGQGCFSVNMKYMKLVVEENVEVEIDGKIYRYFMTNDFNALKDMLWDLKCLPPKPADWRDNPALHKNVIDKMVELGALFSSTQDHGVSVLNYYRQGGTPKIIMLNDFSQKISFMEISALIADLIKTDDAEKLKTIIKDKKDAQRFTQKNFTVLMIAALYNAVQTTRYLIDLGLDVNECSKDGITPLMVAAGRNSMEVVELLLENGADLTLKSKNGWTAYVHALVYNNNEIAQFLHEKEKNKTDVDVSEMIYANLNGEKVSFVDKFAFYISRFTSLGLSKPSDIYKKNLENCMSKQTFSKLRSGELSPSKRNVLLLAVGLHLSVEEATDLLKSAGYAFSYETEDLIFRHYIEVGYFNIFKISEDYFNTTGISLFREPRA